MFSCRVFINGKEVNLNKGGSKMDENDSEVFKKELLQKAVKDQNTLRLSSSNIDRTKEDKELATAIFKLAEISFTIINHINKNQEKIFTARKFIEHYQDKAVMLCRKYSSMDEAASVVVDEDFINTKSNIRNVLISFVEIFNNEYKKITDTDHIDINAELAVLVEDMKQQGVEVSNLHETDSTKANARREKVQEVYNDIEDRLDSIDLSEMEETTTKKKESSDYSSNTQEVCKDPMHPMYGMYVDPEVEEELIEYGLALSRAIDGRFSITEIRKIESDYAKFWYDHIAKNKDIEKIHETRMKYVSLAILPTGIFSFHKHMVQSETFLIRMILFWTFIPYLLSLGEGFKVLIKGDKEFLANEGLDLFFDSADWAKIISWYDSNKRKRRIASGKKVDYSGLSTYMG
jgi:hypothetical protein